MKKYMAIVLCILFYALQGWGWVRVDWMALGLFELLMLSLLGIFVADLLSGLIHLLLDYYPLNIKAGIDKLYFYQGSRDDEAFTTFKNEVVRQASPVDMISYNFKIHHAKPKHMNRKSYAEQMLDTVIPALVLTLAGILLPQAWGFCGLVTAFFVAQTQFVHACVHDTPRSNFWKRVIQKLQAVGVIYSLAEHVEHHRNGQSNFCLITGWANRVLNPVCLWLLKKDIISRAFWESLRRYR